MQGLSLRELAEELEGALSHNALAKYENGEMMPGSELLGRLADALEQPPDYFFRPFTLELTEIRFRKKVRFGKKGEEAIRAQALEYFERYREVEELLGEVKKFEGKLTIPEISTPEDADNAADELRKVWKLGCDPLPNFVELLESKGIKIFELPSPEDDFDGFSADTQIGPVIVIAPGKNILRKRMTLAHELAHLVLPLSNSLSLKDEENIAKRFAGALLLPKAAFLAAFGKGRRVISLIELIEMKVNFGASISSIMLRAKQLGLINEAVYIRFCRQANKWRAEKKEPGDERYQGSETHSRFRQLVHRAIAEDQISMSKGAAFLVQSLSETRRDLQEVFA